MKISLFSDEVSQDLTAVVALAKEYGLDALEIRSAWGRGVFDFTAEDISRVASTGIAISAVASPFLKCDIFSDDEVKAHLEGFIRCLDMAKAWNTKVIRGFTGWRVEKNDAYWVRLRQAFMQPLAALEGEGVIIALESDPSVCACNAAELNETIARIDSPYVKIMWDPGNDIFAPEAELPYPDGYEFIKNNLAHVHLKDAVKDGDTVNACRLGDGQARIFDMLHALKCDKYDGYLTLEPHYRAGGQLSEDQIKLPGGANFSSGDALPAIECIRALKDMMGRL